MQMRQIQFTEEEIAQLTYESIHNAHAIIRRRMLAVRLKAQGMPHKEIGATLGISQTTLRKYFDAFEAGKVEGLKQLNYKGKPNRLMEKKAEIIPMLEADPPATYKEAQAKIKAQTGLERSLPQVREFLKRNKIIRRKVKQIPAKADIEAQESFKTGTLEPLVEQATLGMIYLFFMDAAHFVLSPFLGYLYSLSVRFIKSSSGRQRFSVLGALNAITKEIVTITDHAYINSASVCALLEKLHQQFLDLPIAIVLDNARYQHCALVIEKARQLGIQLIFLPPYSPNLNLIERLWKFVKREVLYNKYYPKYEQFYKTIANCLEQTGTTYKEELDTLLVAKFQSFKNATIQP